MKSQKIHILQKIWKIKRYTFNTVNDGAGKIVGRVNFVFVSCGRMGLGFASINSRIPHTTIVWKHVHFGSDRTFLTRLSSLYHLGPKFQIQFHRVGPIFGIGPKVKIKNQKKYLIAHIFLTTGFWGKEAWRPTPKWNTRFFFAFSKRNKLWLP